LKAQEQVDIDREGRIQFKVDLVMYDSETSAPLCVLDTKYKNPNSPATADIAQVIAYAEAKGCRHAFLIYPERLSNALDATVGTKRVGNLIFSLDGDIEQQGQFFMQGLRNALR
jgi:5-methylcytosine-specific restriction enzyme subunit McrC